MYFQYIYSYPSFNKKNKISICFNLAKPQKVEPTGQETGLKINTINILQNLP